MGQLRRDLGPASATMLGLGSILGTGVFVSLGLGAGLAGPAVVLAVAIAAGVAACNALSSAQLASAHPVAGGAYEYGYRLLTPALGFTAGWVFLIAKSASAATAALGIGGYALELAGQTPALITPLALLAIAVVTALAAMGIRRTATINTAIVAITILSLLYFVIAAMPAALRNWSDNATPFFVGASSTQTTRAFLEATALMFVAYTGYGRIATLGEEVRDPERTIPRAIIATLIVSMLIYCAVAAVAIGAAGPSRLADATERSGAPLAQLSDELALPLGPQVMAVGALTAMVGVLLNLVLGLSRVALAMARRGDMPRALAHVSKRKGSPWPAVLAVGAAIGAIAALGDLGYAWSLSAFTVLVYYAINNGAALRLPPAARLYPRVIPWMGLAACASLALMIEPGVMLVGAALIVIGHAWRCVSRR